MTDLRRKRPSTGLLLLIGAAGLLAVLAVVAYRRGGSAAPSPSPASTAASSVGSASAAGDGGLPPSIPNAAASIAKIRPSLRACFAEQIRRAPTPVGKVTFAIEVGADGSVTSATPKTHDGLDDAGLACMVRGVKAGTFDRPLDGLPATVIAPFTFNSVGDRRLPGTLPSAFLPPTTPRQ